MFQYCWVTAGIFSREILTKILVMIKADHMACFFCYKKIFPNRKRKEVRIMILFKEGFADALREAGDYFDNPYADLDMILSGLPEEEQKSRREEYLLDFRIMKATSMEEVSDITFDQVLDCISSSELFAELFERQKARYYFERMERLRSVRTQRKRRIL